jgi:hypothetical protein
MSANVPTIRSSAISHDTKRRNNASIYDTVTFGIKVTAFSFLVCGVLTILEYSVGDVVLGGAVLAGTLVLAFVCAMRDISSNLDRKRQERN